MSTFSKKMKIAFFGLDNAGKTSILTALKQKFDFMDQVSKLQPTLSVDRNSFSFNFLNTQVVQFDFGGQFKYRQEYLEHKDRYLSETDLIYYVIDVQDPLRFKESITYFNEIAEFYQIEGIKMNFVIFLHKFDPSLRTDPGKETQYRDIIREMMALKKVLNEWLPVHDLYFFESSIYDVVSLIRAFSFGMQHVFPKKEILDNYLESVGKDFETISMMLFDFNGISLSEYFKRHITSEERKKCRELFLNAQKRISDSITNAYEFSDWISYDKRVSGVIQAFTIGYHSFYIVAFMDETTEEEAVNLLDRFEAYKKDLSDILEGLIAESNVPI
jgi:signal recognition particle receptor subunit beta